MFGVFHSHMAHFIEYSKKVMCSGHAPDHSLATPRTFNGLNSLFL